ncbi:MAG TPA: energy-coupling factor ABC transporter permease [Rhodocyclaceae bacterium]|nr:energy-coupling factor ABC transporter permease [Betaproteobacteria bacterium]HMV00956.1 energy-coupling factor ABC transporter permease [Rhodocyclaceae bacterium]HMV22134.1 energy-coupling factor ABC transporter permease [Rhodocyclaceae bacterium]HMW76900.1 energy-coupling factor ABC transporter permease [Rhodocyclaceae bacterium]HNE42040.1 energy-coupling factor ABC transporter permease [Rhodocyclaceae bacterium]
MNLPDSLLAEGWYWAAWVLWSPLFARAVWRAPWSVFKDSSRFNLWLGLIVGLTLMWSLKAGVKPGLTLHLLGATAMTLSFGPQLAFIALNLVLAAVMVNEGGGAASFALNALLLAGWGVFLSDRIYRIVDRFLPRHFFIYIFVNGFFGSAATVIGVGAAASSLMVLAGAYPAAYLLEEYLPYFLLLGFSEAWLSGMAMTLLVVYFPGWVATFDDSRYLAGK